ncbi:MAG: hypothetical protein HC786_21240 [Richelia sp. CSU_2_1]|nr:hypothetical protein [Richelia sp. CSU_2_1]
MNSQKQEADLFNIDRVPSSEVKGKYDDKIYNNAKQVLQAIEFPWKELRNHWNHAVLLVNVSIVP